MANEINDDALIVQLTVNQIRGVMEGVLKQLSFPSNNYPETIDIEDVAKMTGYKKATIYKLIHERKIPFYKPDHGGRRVFFKAVEIEQWLQSNRIETNEMLFQSHGKNNHSQTDDIKQLQQRLHSLKALQKLFIFFLGIINSYKAKIQELEETVAKYERNNQTIEILTINTNKNDDN